MFQRDENYRFRLSLWILIVLTLINIIDHSVFMKYRYDTEMINEIYQYYQEVEATPSFFVDVNSSRVFSPTTDVDTTFSTYRELSRFVKQLNGDTNTRVNILLYEIEPLVQDSTAMAGTFNVVEVDSALAAKIERERIISVLENLSIGVVN